MVIDRFNPFLKIFLYNLKGEFVDDKKEGFGVYYWPNGNRHQGQYLNDLKHGIGTHLYVFIF